ncbi:hypothetical protein H696_02377 [Fonticula alba]|uniref:Uncharacterized protein n=1 Tax=Fonticula alba TaxID=691883 RepID=A0A058ZAI9_FONAL|nr:hypothetical protein H696_02377 [Fonticula alba]KCV71429.1 hypothetical protein H696_02377 [Fonticula alba]|eukprot:XP_009494552.1 hypothetical protein H696_02377 [Fonticula alba]
MGVRAMFSRKVRHMRLWHPVTMLCGLVAIMNIGVPFKYPISRYLGGSYLDYYLFNRPTDGGFHDPWPYPYDQEAVLHHRKRMAESLSASIRQNDLSEVQKLTLRSQQMWTEFRDSVAQQFVENGDFASPEEALTYTSPHWSDIISLF